VKTVKVLAVTLLGPLSGILIGFVVSLFMLPAEPSGVVGRSPGDGFLIIGLVSLGFLISLRVSAGIAVRIWRRSHQPIA
jgi:preprotein translocase subunit Sss1